LLVVSFNAVSSDEATAEYIQQADDEEYANCNELTLPRTPVNKPLPPIPMKKSAPHRNPAALHPQADPTAHIGKSSQVKSIGL